MIFERFWLTFLASGQNYLLRQRPGLLMAIDRLLDWPRTARADMTPGAGARRARLNLLREIAI
ncbi:hypothetical protein ACFONL_03100 [Camelimonas fluminis]|uniref:Uncharacterized protein n=1 Tax=Camelimonas fluminis TaxID=1576911 RepID=A0ABV7UCI8_9HYPH